MHYQKYQLNSISSATSILFSYINVVPFDIGLKTAAGDSEIDTLRCELGRVLLELEEDDDDDPPIKLLISIESEDVEDEPTPAPAPTPPPTPVDVAEVGANLSIVIEDEDVSFGEGDGTDMDNCPPRLPLLPIVGGGKKLLLLAARAARGTGVSGSRSSDTPRSAFSA